MVDWFAKEFQKKHKLDLTKSARALRRLRTACEKAKRALSSGATAQVEVESLFEGIDLSSSVTRYQQVAPESDYCRAKFEELCAPMFKRCIDTVKSVLKARNYYSIFVVSCVMKEGF